MNDLEMYREQLALCDDKIIDALVERNSIIEKIMAYKEEYGMPILQPQQEEKQKKRLEEKLSDNRYKEEIFDVFGCILRNSKRIQARKLFDYNIVLIGFMGAGKTTISDYLSTMFDMDIVEMDQVIAEREEMSISDIFATYGEEYFRDLETNLLIEMQSHKNAVISCGGGAALRERNVAEMKKNGRVVLLTATPETIYERVKDSNDRPVLNGRKNVKGISVVLAAFIYGYFLMEKLDKFLKENQSQKLISDSKLRIGFETPAIIDSIADLLEQFSSEYPNYELDLAFHS